MKSSYLNSVMGEPLNVTIDIKSPNAKEGRGRQLSIPDLTGSTPNFETQGGQNSPKQDKQEAQIPSTKELEVTPILGRQVMIDDKGLVTITFKNLSYSVEIKNNQKGKDQPKYITREILRGLTGICKPGELTAIMGASGAGKTTLLNILSVRASDKGKKKLSGEILANGQPYDVAKFSKFAGYVMQNDILLETMTPREIFTFTAHLRLAGSSEEKKRKVDKLLADLKLERAADTFVGGTFAKGISGGERKRTSIGLELMTDPNLIFLDEPTSGLDSFTAFILITLLKNLAKMQGKTIVFTIHQPSSDIFVLFDKLMILAKGKFIYQGPARVAVEYFGAVGYQCPEFTNPADYFIEIAHSNGNDDEKFEDMYKAYDSTIAPNIIKEVDKIEPQRLHLAEKVNGFFMSASLIARRSLLNFLRNPMLLKGRIIQTIFISFLTCCIYFRLSDDIDESETNLSSESENPIEAQGNSRVIYDINGALFFFSVSLFMMSCMSVVLTFPAERAVFLREYSSNMYSVSAYYFGRSSTEIPFIILFPVLMTAVCYYIIGFNDYNAGKFFIFMLILVFVALAGNAGGLLAGSIFSDPKVASNIMPAIVLPMMVFAGFYINSESMPVWLFWIQYLSPFRYSLEAFMWNQYSDSFFGTGQLERYDYGLGIWGAFGLLVAVGLVIRLAALLFLKLLVRRLE